jgi:hypothetical protein
MGRSSSPGSIIRTGFEAHRASYTMGKGALSQGVKQPGRETHYSPPISAEVKKTWISTSTPPYEFMA